MSAALTTQSATLAQLIVPQATMQVYSLLVDAKLTKELNTNGSAEHGILAPLTTPLIFNVPQVCNGTFSSGQLSCNVVSYLVFLNNDSGSVFLSSVQSGSVMYVMVKSVLYLASYNASFESMVQNQNAKYATCNILALYTIVSTRNVSVSPGCQTSIVPFFGALSDDSTATIEVLLGLASVGTSTSAANSLRPIHIMAILI